MTITDAIRACRHDTACPFRQCWTGISEWKARCLAALGLFFVGHSVLHTQKRTRNSIHITGIRQDPKGQVKKYGAMCMLR